MYTQISTVQVPISAPIHNLNILLAHYENISQGKKMAGIIQITTDLKIKEEKKHLMS